MWSIRKDKEIYSADGGWFQARWHFSFDRYRDEQQMGVGALRVFNDDRIVGGAVWPMHPHRDIASPFRTASPHPASTAPQKFVRAARQLDGPVDIVWPADATCD